jgi:predicted dehydrogenase
MNQPLRWGILGTGKILQKFGEAFRMSRGIELVAIASRDLARAEAAARQLGARKAHGSYAALIADPEVDIVLNALHNGLHGEWTIRALEAGKHVLCEKPLARSRAEAAMMFAAAHRHQRWLMEAFMFRFHPQMPEIKRRIQAGDIGRPLYIRSSYTGRGREPGNPRTWKDDGGGALLDIGCYCVNFSRFAAGTEPVRVEARAHFSETTGIDLTLAATLEFPAELIAHFVCSFEAEGLYGAEIVGTEARLSVPHPWLPPTWPAEISLVRQGKPETIRVLDGHAPSHFLAPFVLELEHFNNAVRENQPPTIVTETDSLANAAVLDALRQSASAK